MNLHVVDVMMLPITAKHAVILKLDLVSWYLIFNERMVHIKKINRCLGPHANVQLISFFLASSNSEFRFKIKESLLKQLDQPVLNKTGASLPLCLFD